VTAAGDKSVTPVTAALALPSTLVTIKCNAVRVGETAMDASYFRDKAATCLRLAKGLSWNNPARDELIELAEEFQRQAAELEASASVEQRPGC
jgi:hypothetical protein